MTVVVKKTAVDDSSDVAGHVVHSLMLRPHSAATLTPTGLPSTFVILIYRVVFNRVPTLALNLTPALRSTEF